MTITRSYSELRRLPTFLERFQYLSLKGTVGLATFGFERYLNQRFYTSTEWRNTRHKVIVRDNGCDLGIDGHEVHDKIIIHHMNPMTRATLAQGGEELLDIEFLISVSHETHNAIHYGDEKLLPRSFVERSPGDTRLW